jgi:hypothetical protein
MEQEIIVDFKGGYNDTLSPLDLGKNEMVKAENADINTTVQGFKTRKGTSIHHGATTHPIDYCGEFMVEGTIITYIVMNNILYRLVDGELVVKKSGLSDTRIYEFNHNSKLYFTDTEEYYVWGEYDYTSESGTEDIETGDIVLNLGSTGGGVEDKFYKALGNHGSTDLGSEDFSNTSNWEECTEVDGKMSSVVRPVENYDGSQVEIAKLEIFDGADEEGTVSVILDDVAHDIDVYKGDDVETVVARIVNSSYTGYTVTKDGNVLTFIADTPEVKENGYFDPQETGVIGQMYTEVNGRSDNNDLEPIKKCTMFLVHPTSMRVFACGNPEDPEMLYYSDLGNPAYFSKFQRLVPIQGEGAIKALINISDAVLISYANSWYKWRGIEVGEDAQFKSLALPYGAVNNDCVALTPYSFTYLSKNGLFTVSASIIGEDTSIVSNRSMINNIAKDKVMKTINSIGNQDNVQAVFHDNKYLLAYSETSGSNDKVLEYSWDNKAFTKITGWEVTKWIKSDDFNLYFASGNYLLKAFDGYKDIDVSDGSDKNIDLDVVLRYLSFKSPMIDKLLRFIKVLASKEGASAKIDLSITGGNNTVSITDMSLASSLVGADNETIERIKNMAMLSDYFRINISSSEVNNPVTIIGLALDYEIIRSKRPNIVNDSTLLS